MAWHTRHPTLFLCACVCVCVCSHESTVPLRLKTNVNIATARSLAPSSPPVDLSPPPEIHAIASRTRTGSFDTGGRASPFSSRAPRGLVPGAAGHGLVLSSQGAGRRVDGGLLSVAEVAAAIFQSEKWEGIQQSYDRGGGTYRGSISTTYYNLV